LLKFFANERNAVSDVKSRELSGKYAKTEEIYQAQGEEICTYILQNISNCMLYQGKRSYFTLDRNFIPG